MATAAEQNVYLSGYMSGIATALIHGGVRKSLAPRVAQGFVEQLLADPAFRMEIERTVDAIKVEEGPVGTLTGVWLDAPPPR